MDPTDKDSLRQIDNLLASSQQSWLFGAGISRGANIPLMIGLTNQVVALAEKHDKAAKDVLDVMRSELPPDAHIEHMLSQLGDHSSMAERSRSKSAKIGASTLTLEDLHKLHSKILVWIADTIRWGYVAATATDPEKIGARGNPLVTIHSHLAFVSALFNRNQAGVAERRRPVRLFTTNYDTLLEDALALNCFSYWDGFAGGALAFRCHRYGQNEPDLGCRAHLVKLHGSIDWHLSDDGRIYRVRESDSYPARTGRVLIYPQATKYLATQRDPFSSQFDLFRRSLNMPTENVLAICGYGFGDEHINQEIELALQRPDNKTTILAFASTTAGILERWQKTAWSRRLHVVSAGGLFMGKDGPYFPPAAGNTQDWWTFDGVTKILTNGAEACVA